jgi:hypothetical protein
MREQFIEKRFRQDTEVVIMQAEQIIAAYQKQGYTLTLRQLYYQFVARGLIENTERSYDRIGSIINDARLAGYIDWDAIEDRTRGLESLAHWDSPRSGVQALRDQFRIDMWENQPERVEVWIEKEALVGVVEGVCRQNDVPYLACRGYVSQSEQWRAYRRILDRFQNHGQRTHILHFGDHDPSGIDMTRDNTDRLGLFLRGGLGLYPNEDDYGCEVHRLALNMDQIKKYNPPPNPAKMTDSRFGSYVERFGKSSWELDALEPKVIVDLIGANIALYRDDDLWNERHKVLKQHHATLDGIIEGLPK